MELSCSVGMKAEDPMPPWLAPKPKIADRHPRQGGAGLRDQGLLFQGLLLRAKLFSPGYQIAGKPTCERLSAHEDTQSWGNLFKALNLHV